QPAGRVAAGVVPAGAGGRVVAKSVLAAAPGQKGHWGKLGGQRQGGAQDGGDEEEGRKREEWTHDVHEAAGGARRDASSGAVLTLRSGGPQTYAVARRGTRGKRGTLGGSECSPEYSVEYSQSRGFRVGRRRETNLR